MLYIRVSSLSISTLTVCHQNCSRRIELTTQRRPLKVLKYSLPAVDAEDLSALVLLDLSAVDTVDHGIPQHQLGFTCQMVGSVHNGFNPTSILPVKPVTARASRIVLFQLNAAKTKILWSAASRRLHQLSQAPSWYWLRDLVRCSPRYWNTSRLRHSMSSHVRKTVSTCYAVMLWWGSFVPFAVHCTHGTHTHGSVTGDVTTVTCLRSSGLPSGLHSSVNYTGKKELIDLKVLVFKCVHWSAHWRT